MSLRRACELTAVHGSLPWELPDPSVPEGNVFHIFAVWNETAALVGWPASARREVLAEAKTGDYDYARLVLRKTLV